MGKEEKVERYLHNNTQPIKLNNKISTSGKSLLFQSKD